MSTPPPASPPPSTNDIVRSLFDFRSMRIWWMALAFYAFYVILAVMVGGMITGFSVMLAQGLHTEQSVAIGIKIGELFAILASVALFALIMRARNAMRDPVYLAGMAATVVLSWLGGVVLGMLPSAVLLVMWPAPDKTEKL